MSPLLLLTLAACGKGELDINFTSIDWGEIDFQSDECPDCQCDGGCGPTLVELINVGDAPLNVSIPDGLDPDRFCLDGFSDLDDPIVIPALEPDDAYILELSICGYLPGEQTLTVSGQITFETDGVDETVGLPWTYTPIRVQ